MRIIKLSLIFLLLLIIAGCGEINNFRIWNDAINIMNGVENITFKEEIIASYRTTDMTYTYKYENIAEIIYDPYKVKVNYLMNDGESTSTSSYYFTSENEELFLYETKDNLLYKYDVDEDKYMHDETISVIDFSLNYMPSKMKKVSSTLDSDKLLNTYTNTFKLENISSDYLHVFDETLMMLTNATEVNTNEIKDLEINETILINSDKSIHQIKFDLSKIYESVLLQELPYAEIYDVKLIYQISFLNYDTTTFSDSLEEFILDEAPDYLEDAYLYYPLINDLDGFNGELQTRSDKDVLMLDLEIDEETNVIFNITGSVDVYLVDELGYVARHFSDEDLDGIVNFSFVMENSDYYLMIVNLDGAMSNSPYHVEINLEPVEGTEI